MIASRRWPSATRPSGEAQVARPSGPRWPMHVVIRSTRGNASGERLTRPAMPHMTRQWEVNSSAKVEYGVDAGMAAVDHRQLLGIKFQRFQEPPAFGGQAWIHDRLKPRLQ